MVTALVRAGYSRQGIVVLQGWATRRQRYGDHGAPHHHNRAKTHCTHGHKYTAQNTRLYRGWRYCRACLQMAHGAQARQRLRDRKIRDARRNLMGQHPDQGSSRAQWQRAFDRYRQAQRQA